MKNLLHNKLDQSADYGIYGPKGLIYAGPLWIFMDENQYQESKELVENSELDYLSVEKNKILIWIK